MEKTTPFENTKYVIWVRSRYLKFVAIPDTRHKDETTLTLETGDTSLLFDQRTVQFGPPRSWLVFIVLSIHRLSLPTQVHLSRHPTQSLLVNNDGSNPFTQGETPNSLSTRSSRDYAEGRCYNTWLTYRPPPCPFGSPYPWFTIHQSPGNTDQETSEMGKL